MLKHYQFFFFVFILGALLSLSFNQYLLNEHDKQDKGHFLQLTTERFTSFSRALASEWEILETFSHVFQVNKDISRIEFSQLTRHIHKQHPEIKAIEWIPKIKFSEKETFEKRARLSGIDHFFIKEMTKNGHIQAVQQREYYYPVYYAEPVRGNEKSLGFDLGSDSQRLEALLIAAIDNNITTTAPIKLIQDKDNKLSILAISPVYKNLPNFGIAEHKPKNIRGYVGLVLQIQDFFDYAITDAFDDENIAIAIVDIKTNQLLSSSNGQTVDNKAYYYREEIIDTGRGLDLSVVFKGRTWKIMASADKHFHGRFNVLDQYKTLIIGLLLSFLIAIYFQKQKYTQAEITKKVDQQTLELQKINAINNSILATAVDAFISINEKGIVSRFNHAAERLLGYSSDEVIGNNVSMLMPPEFAAHHDTFLQDYVQTGVEHIIGKNTSTFAQHKNGSQIAISLAISDTGISGDARFTGVMHDQRSMLIAQKELSEQRYALNQHAIVGITDVRGTIIYANDKFCQISGYSKAELIGQNHRILNSGNKPKNYWKAMYKKISSGHTWHDEVKNTAKDGSSYWVDTTIVPVMSIDRKPSSYISIRTDITERIRIQKTLQGHHAVLEQTVAERTRDLQISLEKEEHANKEKSRFLANMSHELRTPMHAILSFTDLTIKKESDEKKLKFLNNIKASGLRLTELLDNLLDLAKLEAGKIVTDFQPADLNLITKMSMSDLQSLAIKKNIQFHLTTSEPVNGEFDTKLIQQVIINLLSNALKFSPENSEIIISTKTSQHKLNGNRQEVLELSVTDHGIGIPEADLKIIFDKFIQSSKTVSKAGGTGLGLPICQEIIGYHHGKIWAVSPLENGSEGSCFYFIIPVKQVS